MRFLSAFCFLLFMCFVSSGQEQVPELRFLKAKHEKAIPVLLDLKVESENEKDTFMLANVLSLLGNCRYYVNDDQAAMQYWKRSLLFGQLSGNKEFVAGVYNTLANGYSETDPDSGL